MYGKITMSRIGIMGSLRGSDFSRDAVMRPPGEMDAEKQPVVPRLLIPIIGLYLGTGNLE
jgi:hypothetical protein